MKYHMYETAAAIDGSCRMELKDVMEIAGSLLFILCAMAVSVALL